MEIQQSLGGGGKKNYLLKEEKIIPLQTDQNNGIINNKYSKNEVSMRNKIAFTLAEVLITLGVIGIVAAMTLPTVIQKHQQKVAVTRLKQTYSQLFQAINLAQAEYGDYKNWPEVLIYGTAYDPDDYNGSRKDYVVEFFDKYIIPHLKLSKKPVYAAIDTLGYRLYKTKDGRDYSFFSSGREVYVCELSNGVSLFMSIDGTSDKKMTRFLIFADINGKTKPNVLGRDLFLFRFTETGGSIIVPYGLGFNQIQSRDDFINACAENSSNSDDKNLYCTGLIAHDGWEIKKDFPW